MDKENMKQIAKIILLMSMVSCIDIGQPSYLSSIDSSKEGDRRIRARSRSAGSGNQCENTERCEDICDQILDYSSERRDCYGLSLKEIGIVEDVFDDLKHPTESKLNDIRAGDFDLFASVALSSWSNMIQGDYRRDEANDDDDKENDDWEDTEYDEDEAEDVLEWIIDERSIAESILDFSGRETNILSDLLVQMDNSLSCSGEGSIICNGLKNDGLSSTKQTVLAGIRSSSAAGGRSYLGEIVRLSNSDDEVSAVYEMTHDALAAACENVDSLQINSKTYGRDHSYKMCLSWIYFCPSVYGSGNFHNQIDQYLLKDTYRSTPESSLKNCEFDSSEPRWSDYWN